MRGLAIIAIAGCGRIAFDPAGGATGSVIDGAVSGGTDAPGVVATDAGASGMGSGTITGTPPLSPFPSVMAAYVVGHPQFAGDTAIYLLSQPVACNQLTATGWAYQMTGPTSILELLLAGTAATTYPVSSNIPPMPPNAYTNDIYANSGGFRITRNGDSGQVVVAAIDPDGTTHGTFSVTFAGSTVSGSFVAAYCATGTYP